MFGRAFGIVDSRAQRRFNEALSGNPSLNSEEFYIRYFKDKGYPKELVLKVRNIFDEILDFDLSHISDTSDFSKELKFIWDYDSLAAVQIIQEIEKAFQISITDDEATQMNTMSDIVRIVSHHISSKAAEQDAAANP